LIKKLTLARCGLDNNKILTILSHVNVISITHVDISQNNMLTQHAYVAVADFILHP